MRFAKSVTYLSNCLSHFGSVLHRPHTPRFGLYRSCTRHDCPACLLTSMPLIETHARYSNVIDLVTAGLSPITLYLLCKRSSLSSPRQVVSNEIILHPTAFRANLGFENNLREEVETTPLQPSVCHILYLAIFWDNSRGIVYFPCGRTQSLVDLCRWQYVIRCLRKKIGRT